MASHAATRRAWEASLLEATPCAIHVQCGVLIQCGVTLHQRSTLLALSALCTASRTAGVVATVQALDFFIQSCEIHCGVHLCRHVLIHQLTILLEALHPARLTL